MCLLRLSSKDTYVTSMIADRPSKTVNTSIRFCRAVNADQSGEQTDRLDIYIPTTSCQARSETGRSMVVVGGRRRATYYIQRIPTLHTHYGRT